MYFFFYQQNSKCIERISTVIAGPKETLIFFFPQEIKYLQSDNILQRLNGKKEKGNEW